MKEISALSYQHVDLDYMLAHVLLLNKQWEYLQIQLAHKCWQVINKAIIKEC